MAHILDMERRLLEEGHHHHHHHHHDDGGLAMRTKPRSTAPIPRPVSTLLRRVGNVLATVLFSILFLLAIPFLTEPLLSIPSSIPSAAEYSTADVVPLPCHSHNDYWRRIPVYSALAAGCVSVEADIWHLPSSPGSLFVGHSRSALVPARTLQSLYIEPLVELLEDANRDGLVGAGAGGGKEGVFEMDPQQTTVLLVDFKTSDERTWTDLIAALTPLREKGWLTQVNGMDVVAGPVTVVLTGDAPFDHILAHEPRDVFFDAPLAALEDAADEPHQGFYRFNKTNSYYASAPLPRTSPPQAPQGNALELIRKQVKQAADRGLKARYWDTPAWPVGVRNHVWKVLVDEGVGALNVDDLKAVGSFWPM